MITAESKAPSGLGRFGDNCLSKLTHRFLFTEANSFAELDIHIFCRKRKLDKDFINEKTAND